MKKNLILMTALFAGAMIVNDGLGANLGGDITNVDELTTHGELSNIDNSDLLNTTYNIEENRDFKFKNRLYLRIFIRTYHKYIKTMDLLTPDRLSNINTFSLIVTADNIKNGSVLNMQKETQELILNKILAALTNRDFKFESYDDLGTFISAYHDNAKAMDLITPDRLSNIDTFPLIVTAENIKTGWWGNIQKETKKLLFNTILTALTNRDFKFDDRGLRDFIFVYRDNTKAMDIITPDRLSNINTYDLTDFADALTHERSLSDAQKETNESILNKILATLTNRDFKFEDPQHLKNFIRAYDDNTTAMDLITPDRLSNINTSSLIVTANNIKNGFWVNIQKETQELILNKIFTALINRDFKFESFNDLMNFIAVYRDNTKAMDIITSDRLSNIPNERLESSVKCLNDFLPHANPSEKVNIQRAIDIIDQKLLQISLL